MKAKLTKLCRVIFGIGQMFIMAATMLILAAYIFAIAVGGELAVDIEDFVYNEIFPIMFFAAIALAFVGIIYVYLTGFMTFRFDAKPKKKQR